MQQLTLSNRSVIEYYSEKGTIWLKFNDLCRVLAYGRCFTCLALLESMCLKKNASGDVTHLSITGLLFFLVRQRSFSGKQMELIAEIIRKAQ